MAAPSSSKSGGVPQGAPPSASGGVPQGAPPSASGGVPPVEPLHLLHNASQGELERTAQELQRRRLAIEACELHELLR